MSGKFLNAAVVGALLASTTVFSGTVSAADVYELGPVVVTATKLAERADKVPASVSVVTAQDIEKHNYTSTEQALGQLPGVYLSPKADGGISMRGYSSEDILVLIDGQPVNSGWNGKVDWALIPVHNIEKIEVVRGAASSLYGGRAVGGVIQITTKNHEDGLHGNVVLTSGSKSTTKQVYDASIKKDKWDIGVGYEKRKTDGWANYYVTKASGSASGPELSTTKNEFTSDGKLIGGSRGRKSYDTESYHVKTAYNFNDHQSLTYSFAHSNETYKYNYPYSFLRDANGNEAFWGYVNVAGKNYSFTPSNFLGYVNKKEWNVHDFSYNDTKNLFNVRFGITDIKKDGFSLGTSGIKPSNYTSAEMDAWNGVGTLSFYPSKTKDFDMNKTWELGKHTLLAGVGYRQESLVQTRYNLEHYKDYSSKTSIFQINKGKSESWAGYLQDKWQANDKLAIYAGVRFDRYKKYDGSTQNFYDGINNKDKTKNYNPKYLEENTYSQVSPKLSIEYSTSDDSSVYASYGHSFTPPLLYNLYRSEGYFEQTDPITGQTYVTGTPTLANPDLKPEKTDTYELGYKKSWKDKDTLRVAVYKAKTKDAIEMYKTKESSILGNINYPGGYKIYYNAVERKKKGFEIEGTHKFNDKWSTYVNYSWQSADVKGNPALGFEDKHNYDVPKHILHFGTRYNYKKWDVLADAEYISARQAPDTVTGVYNSEDAFFITNLAVNYAVTPQASLQFSIYNLFDREFYASEATSERTYAMSLQYKF